MAVPQALVRYDTRMNGLVRIRLLGVFAVLLVLYGCETSGPLISDEEICTRYGGLWRPEGCRSPGGGGGGM
jgi:hypothetical protein